MAPSRHEKMVRAATYLAEQGYDISRMPAALGKGGAYKWKRDATSDPALVSGLLHGTMNSVVIPRGETVVIDADTEEANAELQRLMPGGLVVLSPTAGHAHFYGRYPDPSTLPDVYEGGEVRRDPGGKDAPGGAGGMVIGPWSMTSAGTYTIADGPRNIPVLPEAVADWLRTRDTRAQARAPINGHAPGEPIVIAVGGYVLPERVATGGRYAATREYTASLYNRGLSPAEMWPLVRDVLAPRFDETKDDRALRHDFNKLIEEMPQRLGERAIDRREQPVEMPEVGPSIERIKRFSEQLPPPAITDWLVNDLMRPGTIGLIAAPTGLGKSYMRTELSVRLATGTGALFGHYGIPKSADVLVYDGENGEAEEFRRLDDICTALGVPRTDLARLYGADDKWAFNIDLNEPAFQREVMADIALYEPDVVMFDTIGTFTRGVEWGKEMHKTVAFLRSLTAPRADGYRSAVVNFAHFAKTPRDRGRRPTLDVDDVMGQWSRFMDWVVTINPVADEPSKVRWQTFKRVPHTDLILEQRDGLWVMVNAAVASPMSVTERRREKLLGALMSEDRTLRGDKGLGHWLELSGDGVSPSTLERDMEALLGEGLVSKQGERPAVYSLSEKGRSVLQPIRLVGVEE